MKRKGLFTTVLLLGAVSLSLFLSQNGEGITTMPRCAIIILSDLDGFDDSELEKADQLYMYLKDEGYTDDDIYFLTEESRPEYDGDPNVENIQASFSWLMNTSRPSSQPVIYIYDHVKWTCGDVTFQLSDGNITTSTIDGWLDSTEYRDLTMVLNGNRSAMAGPELSGPERKIMCSMGSEEENDPDLFNITRGLVDPSSDTDGDGEVSFEEAFWSEYYTVINHGQTPCIWG